MTGRANDMAEITKGVNEAVIFLLKIAILTIFEIHCSIFEDQHVITCLTNDIKAGSDI